jgi:type III restriction enzyme
MATGSGKTVMMAGVILYLYEKGYRNFLFFVNRGQIVEKTKDNFINQFSSKYLFNDKIIINNKQVNINAVDNFSHSQNEYL